MTPERAQVIVDLRAGHTDLADEIGPFIDRIIHRLGDDATDPGGLVRDAGLYRFRTRRRCCDLLFGRMSGLRQDRGLCLFACST